MVEITKNWYSFSSGAIYRSSNRRFTCPWYYDVQQKFEL